MVQRLLAITVLAFGICAARAAAVPVFANGQGVSCEVCHTTFPGMTRYGMMIMMTNFQILQRHLQDQALPIAARVYITSYLANKSQPGSTMVDDLSLLAGGFLGRNFTYYAEQHIIDGGTIGDTEQAWVSWNGLFHGTNSFQLGKYHTPFPFMPAHAWTLADYLLATQTTGQNDWVPNDARWGLAFNGMSNEFMYNLAYLTNSGPTQSALDYNSTNNPQAWDLNVSYGGMSIPFSVGAVGVSGRVALHSGSGNLFDGYDPFTREGLYLGYQTYAWHFQTMYYHGFDAHPDINEYNVSLNGFFFEAERDLGWRNHILVRYDVASSDTLNRQYILDVSHNIQPNIALIGEALAGPQRLPQFGLRLAYAGPYENGKRFVWNSTDIVSVVPAGNAGAAAPAPAVASVAASSPVAAGDANEGAKLAQANGCTGCHGATWRGALGPALYSIEHRMTFAAIAERIKSPTAPMPNFGFSQAQIDDIVSYLSSLDGGIDSGKPIVSLEPETPTDRATISVVFGGAPPQRVSALPIMQMGASTMQSPLVTLQPTANDPHRFLGHVTFSMGGPWIIRINYDGNVMDVPLSVGP